MIQIYVIYIIQKLAGSGGCVKKEVVPWEDIMVQEFGRNLILMKDTMQIRLNLGK